MSPLIALLLFALGAETKGESRYPGASTVFQCTFESSRDEDLNGWPAGWTRRHGPGFPRYVHMRMDQRSPPPNGGCLRVELDGGAAAAYGPSIPVNPDVQYLLEGYVETAGLQHDTAYLSLIFLDSTRARLGSIVSEKISGSSPWRKIRLGPLVAPAGASSVLVGLHVEPQGEMQDLRGTAAFGGLWLGQLPRVVLTAQPAGDPRAELEKIAVNSGDEKRPPKHRASDATFMLFRQGQPIEIACVVSGFSAPAYDIQMRLLDVEGRMLAEHRQRFNESQPAVKADKPNSTHFARTTWRLPADSAGFYRVRAAIVPVPQAPGGASQGEHSPADSLAALPTTSDVELSLAIIVPQTLPPGSEFGWSLSPMDAAVGLAPLGDLLCQSGIGWVKFPFAVSEVADQPPADAAKDKSEKADKADASKLPPTDSFDPLINFSDRLGKAGVRLAGVLQPPCASGDSVKTAYDLVAAEVFSRDPKTWYPSIQPILARLATEIRYWQIGDDGDPGWTGCRDLPGIVSRTKTELDRIGQNVDVGIAWNLAAPLPVAAPGRETDRSGKTRTSSLLTEESNRRRTPWRFLSLPCDETIDNDTLANCLDSAKSAGVARWIVLYTLPREGHSTRERIAHLAQHMLTAKIHGAEGIFIADPLHSERGLVNRNGAPSELFLPWRTTAIMLGGGAYLGDIDLPQGNRIHCFGGPDRYVGVLAGRKPTRETVYLGTELRMCDLWGNSRACPPTISSEDRRTRLAPAPQSTVAVEQLPTFLVGLDGPIVQWQLDAAFSPRRLASVPSATLPVALKLKNAFPQSVTGRVSISGPQNWTIEPRIGEFRLDAGAAWQQQLEVTLPNDVVGGRQMVRLEFEIQADRLYRFTMCRPLEVTLGNVAFDGSAVLDDHGILEVHQALTNLGKKPAGFRCDLLAPDRRRQSSEVILQPAGKSQITYQLPDGGQLLGKTIWLRAEEIDGPRVLNYRIDVPAADSATAPQTAPAEPKRRQPLRPASSLVL